MELAWPESSPEKTRVVDGDPQYADEDEEDVFAWGGSIRAAA